MCYTQPETAQSLAHFPPHILLLSLVLKIHTLHAFSVLPHCDWLGQFSEYTISIINISEQVVFCKFQSILLFWLHGNNVLIFKKKCNPHMTPLNTFFRSFNKHFHLLSNNYLSSCKLALKLMPLHIAVIFSVVFFWTYLETAPRMNSHLDHWIIDTSRLHWL